MPGHLCLKNSLSYSTYFATCRSDSHFVNVEFVCRNGQRTSAHMFYLSSYSQFLRSLFRPHRSEANVVLMLPEFDVETVNNLLSFIYSGQADLYGKQAKLEFTELANQLKISTGDSKQDDSKGDVFKGSTDHESTSGAPETEADDIMDVIIPPPKEIQEISLISDSEEAAEGEDTGRDTTDRTHGAKRVSEFGRYTEEPPQKVTRVKLEKDLAQESPAMTVTNIKFSDLQMRNSRTSIESSDGNYSSSRTPSEVVSRADPRSENYSRSSTENYRSSRTENYPTSRTLSGAGSRTESYSSSRAENFSRFGTENYPRSRTPSDDNYSRSSRAPSESSSRTTPSPMVSPMDSRTSTPIANAFRSMLANGNGSFSSTTGNGTFPSPRPMARPNITMKKPTTHSRIPACFLCGKRFDRPGNLLMHLCATHYSDKFKEMYTENKGKCPECPKVINQREHYFKHVGTTHRLVMNFLPKEINTTLKVMFEKKGPVTPPPCFLCQKSLKTFGEFFNHLASVHYPQKFKDIYDSRNGVCPFCAKRFDNQAGGKRAFITHVGSVHKMVMNFVPDSVRESLKPYMDVAEIEPDEYQMQEEPQESSMGPKRQILPPCGICGKELDTLTNLLCHYARSHFSGLICEKYGPVSYKCSLCPKTWPETSKYVRTSFINHIGSAHRKALDFIPEDILATLKPYVNKYARPLKMVKPSNSKKKDSVQETKAKEKENEDAKKDDPEKEKIAVTEDVTNKEASEAVDEESEGVKDKDTHEEVNDEQKKDEIGNNENEEINDDEDSKNEPVEDNHEMEKDHQNEKTPEADEENHEADDESHEADEENHEADDESHEVGDENHEDETNSDAPESPQPPPQLDAPDSTPPPQDSCPLCLGQVENPSTLQDHLLNYHYKKQLEELFEETSGICPYCPEDLASLWEEKDQYLEHLIEEHDVIAKISEDGKIDIPK